MSAAVTLAGAAPGLAPDWHSIDWRKVYRNVRRLQARIVKALRAGRWGKVKALVYLLVHSLINHDWLLANVPMDKAILHKWLKAGFLQKRVFFATTEGTPQGGILSPALANRT